MDFGDVVAAYGGAAKDKLSGPGEREALLTGPVATFIESVGKLQGHVVIAHNEVAELDGTVRPDFGVRVNGVLTGHIELKAPDTSLNPDSYGRTTHNYKQWQRLQELPNLLHTNGLEWRLWRYGVLVDEPLFLHTTDLARAGKGLTGPPRFELLVNSFLEWHPVPITSVSKLVSNLAPLARMLREEVKLALQAERRAIKAGKSPEDQPFLGVARDWRAMLFPNATDAEFADGYAQTVTFALLLAVSDEIDLTATSLHDVAQQLQAHHSLMARALDLLTEHVHNTPTWLAVEMISRVLSAVDWGRIAAGGADMYIHLYEHFLSVYDPEMRKKSGSYYTPVEVVDGMVRLSDLALREYFARPEGLRDPNVAIVDPAMGTGTYPLSVLRHVADSASKQYGPGAASEAVASATARLYGLEIQSAPFSVAELRISSAIRDSGAKFPQHGLNLYVADTLEDPQSASTSQLSYTLQLVAKQRQLANKMKRERNIQVCIGNPPYADHAGGLGGWIESGVDPETGVTPLAAFRLAGNGAHERHLGNLYVYFWRWAFWKVFESTNQPGIRDGGNGMVCFITATGYLAGPGFKGMRNYIRTQCSRGWIINLTPEGKQPPPGTGVFNIETPVAIALFIQEADTDGSTPAEIRYIEFAGARDKKFAELGKLGFGDPRWRTVRSGWSDPFTPSALSEWDQYPALSDVIPWNAPGVLAGRTWVYGPTRHILEERLRTLVNEDNPARKAAMFVENGNINLDASKSPLPGADTEAQTNDGFRKIAILTDPKIVPVSFRAFDRQWLVADSRLLMRPSPTLWHGRRSDQVFMVELHSEHPRSGPGVAFSSLIPDVHNFRGSGGGRVLPWLHPDGSVNATAGLQDVLSARLGAGAKTGDLMAYIAAVVAHPGFVARFDDELKTPGVRVPLTAERETWDRAVSLGRHVLWLHTYGAAGAHPEGITDVRSTDLAGADHPSYEAPVEEMPEELFFEPGTDGTDGVIHLGRGRWSHVSNAVRAYSVGGTNVIDRWAAYRLKIPKGKKKSSLDGINVTRWEGAWSVDFSELLSVLTQLVALEPDQEALLGDVLSGPIISVNELTSAGMVLPRTAKERRPRLSLLGGLPLDEEI